MSTTILSAAHTIGFEAEEPSAWITPPGEVGTALNQLMDRAIRSHTGLTDIGVNTHAQIDTHIGKAVTAGAAFGTDNRIARSNGVNRVLQVSGIELDDSDNIKGVNDLYIAGHIIDSADNPVAEFSKPPGSPVNYFRWTNHKTGFAPIFAISIFSGDDHVGMDISTKGEGKPIRLMQNLATAEMAVFASVADAVNELTFSNAATGNDVSIMASGDDADRGIIIASKGTGVISVPGVGTGGYTDYDLTVGGANYGMARIGNVSFGRTSFEAGDIDLKGAFLFRNMGGPVTGEIEFIFAESTGGTCRFAIPKSAVGNATYSPRSMLIAGPAPANTDFVKVSYWQGQGIFDNLLCDTSGVGADLGVQNNLEVEGNIYVDDIIESTADAGVTVDGRNIGVDGAKQDDLFAFFNGTFIESFNALVTSNGTVVTMTIEQDGGGDLTMNFSDGQTILDCTPAATIALTAGSDVSPTDNFIYILQSTKAITKSTSDWPAAEHIKIGYFLVPSAGFVQTKGVYINHNTNDHAQGTDGQGHLVHITERLRADHAIYRSGGDLTVTIGGGGTTVDVAVTAGVVRQMHKHATPAMNTATGDAILILNQNGAAFDPVTDLETLTNDANGVAVKKYFNWLIAAVANKGGEYSPLIMNLPTGSYNQQQSAETDVDGYDVFRLPSDYDIESATGFLIARVTMSKIGGTWAHVSTVDLRGTNPQSAVGGVGGVTTEFADNAFKVFDEGDNTKELAFQLSGITTGNTRTITMANQNIDLTPGSGAFAAAAHTHEGVAILSTGPVTDGYVLTADGAGGSVWEAGGGGGGMNDLIDDTSPQLGGELDVGAFAINSSSGDVVFECGGTEVMRCSTTHNTLLIGRTTSGNDNWRLHVERTGDSCFGVFGTFTDINARQSGFIFQRGQNTAASPTAVANGVNCGGFFWQPYDGAAFTTMAGIKAVALGAASVELQFNVGTNTHAITLEGAGSLTMELLGQSIVFQGGSIGDEAGDGLAINANPTMGFRIFVDSDLMAGFKTTTMTFYNGAAVEGYFDWQAADVIDMYAGAELVVSLSGTATTAKFGLFGATPVDQAAGMTAALDTVTHTAPGAPDYAFADTESGGWGFSTHDEANTLLSVVANLQARVNELEAMLDATTGIGVAA